MSEPSASQFEIDRTLPPVTDRWLADLHTTAEIGYPVKLRPEQLRALLAHLDEVTGDLAAARMIFGRVRSALSRLTHEALYAREEYDADNAVADFAELLSILITDPTGQDPSGGGRG